MIMSVKEMLKNKTPAQIFESLDCSEKEEAIRDYLEKNIDKINYNSEKYTVKMKIVEFNDNNIYGYGTRVYIYLNPYYQLIVNVNEHQPHEGGTLFLGTIDEFMTEYFSIVPDYILENGLTEFIEHYKIGVEYGNT